MAAITATKDGNWSDATVWSSNPALPGAGDTADSNGYTVTIDQNIEVTTLLGTNAGAGGFSVTAARTIAADITATVRTVLTCSHATGTVAITGNLTGGTASNMKAVVNGAAGTLTVVGNVTGGTASNARGISNDSTGTVTVTGNVTGGSSGVGVHNSLTGTVTVIGTAQGGAQIGANNQSTGTMNVKRAKQSTGAAASVAGINAGGTTTVKELEFYKNGGSGMLLGYVTLLVDADVNACIMQNSVGGADYTLSYDYPTEAQVQSGVTYALGTLTGTLEGGGEASPVYRRAARTLGG